MPSPPHNSTSKSSYLWPLVTLASIAAAVVVIAILQRQLSGLQITIAAHQLSEEKLRTDAAVSKRALTEAERRRAEADEDNKTLLALIDAAKSTKPNRPVLATPKVTSASLMDIYSKGIELAKSGRHEEALAAFLKCFDDGAQVVAFSGARYSAVLMQIARLGESYPPARRALMDRRDAASVDMLADARNMEALRDFSSMNRALKDEALSVAIYDSLPPNDPRRQTLALHSMDTLIAQGRYADALYGRDEDTMARMLNMGINQSQRAESPLRERMRADTVVSGVRNVEVLVGAGKIAQAKELAEKLLKIDPSQETAQRIAAAAKKAGHPTSLDIILRP